MYADEMMAAVPMSTTPNRKKKKAKLQFPESQKDEDADQVEHMHPILQLPMQTREEEEIMQDKKEPEASLSLSCKQAFHEIKPRKQPMPPVQPENVNEEHKDAPKEKEKGQEEGKQKLHNQRILPENVKEDTTHAPIEGCNEEATGEVKQEAKEDKKEDVKEERNEEGQAEGNGQGNGQGDSEANGGIKEGNDGNVGKRKKAKYSWGCRVQIHDASELSAGVSHYYTKVNAPEDDQGLLVYSQIKKIFFEGIAEQQWIQNLRQDTKSVLVCDGVKPQAVWTFFKNLTKPEFKVHDGVQDTDRNECKVDFHVCLHWGVSGQISAGTTDTVGGVL